jgi:hypothetical protein
VRGVTGGLSGLLAVHGFDTALSGILGLITGCDVDAVTSQLLQDMGMSRGAANLVDAGIGIAGSLGVGWARAAAANGSSVSRQIGTFLAGDAGALRIGGKASSGSNSLLSKAGQAVDRNGLTKAGRALQKHGDRVGSVFPKSLGDVATRNAQGQQVLNDLLNSSSRTIANNRYGGFDIWDNVTGRGVRYDGVWNFKGFLDP